MRLILRTPILVACIVFFVVAPSADAATNYNTSRSNIYRAGVQTSGPVESNTVVCQSADVQSPCARLVVNSELAIREAHAKANTAGACAQPGAEQCSIRVAAGNQVSIEVARFGCHTTDPSPDVGDETTDCSLSALP